MYLIARLAPWGGQPSCHFPVEESLIFVQLHTLQRIKETYEFMFFLLEVHVTNG